MCYPKKRKPKDCKIMPLWRRVSQQISMPILCPIAQRFRVVSCEFASHSTPQKKRDFKLIS